jgi:hypothetical protein
VVRYREGVGPLIVGHMSRQQEGRLGPPLPLLVDFLIA